jgi:hypothetical protein
VCCVYPLRLTSFSAKSSMSRMTSRRLALKPFIFPSASGSMMRMGESTAAERGVHSLEGAALRRGCLADALPPLLAGRAAEQKTAVLARQEAILCQPGGGGVAV